ncbi:chemotaxis protein CheW [uncultured Shewanella sp.]|uniref:chemotaxis protein CheW n=1 Tax=uncultured Shewanella sp. TaxID=173975 RepID=UPI00260A6F37|nr:chemotaxis protein CheW [uncultured Shewanella sp.]
MSNLNDEAVSDFFSILLKDEQQDKQVLKPMNARHFSKADAVVERPYYQREKERNKLDKQNLSVLLSSVKGENAVQEIIGCEQGAFSRKGVGHELPTSRGKASLEPFISPKENMTSVDNFGESRLDNFKRDHSEDNQAETVDENIKISTLPSAQNETVFFLCEQLDETFQVLFFELAGLTLAVPLLDLGGIINVKRVNEILGKPAWYLGTQVHRGSHINLVDTCAWMMPENKALCVNANAYKYIALLGNSQWGLTFNRVVKTGQLIKSQVQWRKMSGKRPWLAGVVKEQKCAILDVRMLVNMLNQGLSCQGSN